MYDVSDDGTIFYLPVDPGLDRQELVWVDRSGTVSPVGPQRRRYGAGKLSPDERSILVLISDRSRRADLWLYEIARDAWTRVTTEADNEGPVWSPDGTRFVFSSNRNGPYNLFLMSSDLSTPPKQITNRNWVFAFDWSRDGKLISASEQTQTTGVDIWFVSLEPTAQMRPFLVTAANEGGAVFSPDGRWVAYASDASGQYEVYVVSADGRGRRWMVSTEGGTVPQWNSNGKELIYSKGDALMSVDVTTSPRFESGKPRVLFKGPFFFCSVARDGKRFLMIRSEPAVPSTQINVVEGLLGGGL